MSYAIKQNKMNDHKYIVFKYCGGYYKAIILNNGELLLSIDKSAFKGECYNVQLLKVFSEKLNLNDFDKAYKLSLEWLKWKALMN